MPVSLTFQLNSQGQNAGYLISFNGLRSQEPDTAPPARRAPMMALANGGLHATVRCDEPNVLGPPGGGLPPPDHDSEAAGPAAGPRVLVNSLRLQDETTICQTRVALARVVQKVALRIGIACLQ